jgi:hypothetical protein
MATDAVQATSRPRSGGLEPAARDTGDPPAMGDLKAEIATELYKALERLDADAELLAIVGSWRDTLAGEEALILPGDYNSGLPTLHRAH